MLEYLNHIESLNNPTHDWSTYIVYISYSIITVLLLTGAFVAIKKKKVRYFVVGGLLTGLVVPIAVFAIDSVHDNRMAQFYETSDKIDLYLQNASKELNLRSYETHEVVNGGETIIFKTKEGFVYVDGDLLEGKGDLVVKAPPLTAEEKEKINALGYYHFAEKHTTLSDNQTN